MNETTTQTQTAPQTAKRNPFRNGAFGNFYRKEAAMSVHAAAEDRLEAAKESPKSEPQKTMQQVVRENVSELLNAMEGDFSYVIREGDGFKHLRNEFKDAMFFMNGWMANDNVSPDAALDWETAVKEMIASLRPSDTKS